VAVKLLSLATKFPSVPNQKNREGWAPIHLAVLKRIGFCSIVDKRWMVKAMIDINELVNDSGHSITSYETNIRGGVGELTPL